MMTYLQLLPKEVLEMVFAKRIIYKNYTDGEAFILAINGTRMRIDKGSERVVYGKKRYQVDKHKEDLPKLVRKTTGILIIYIDVRYILIDFDKHLLRQGVSRASFKNTPSFLAMIQYDINEQTIILEWLKNTVYPSN